MLLGVLLLPLALMRFSILNITVIILLLLSYKAKSQCIQAFPHTETFENSNGNWTSGGTGSDWAWGAPTKNIITSSANSTNCWIVGGVSGTDYSLGQRSFIQSPCYNFSNLSHPQVSFDIFWETENIYDGAVLQSSTNNGATWQNVGSSNEPTNCYTKNWYNNSSINGLSGLTTIGHGWAGTSLPTSGSCQGGNGSNTWLNASHCLNNLGGQPNVIFRFAFGAGTLCNNFDGVAIDNFTISSNEIIADFAYQCNGASLEYDFQSNGNSCPQNFSWNFDDPDAGALNQSELENPTHVFSSGGTYQVQLITSHSCATADTFIQTVTTLDNNYTITYPTCHNEQNGSIEAITTNGTVPIKYSLNPIADLNGNQFINLSGGIYTLFTVDNNNCAIQAEIELSNPKEISWDEIKTVAPECAGTNNGRIEVLANSDNGGTLTYTNIKTQEQNENGLFQNLLGGQYSIQVSDAQSCTSITQVNIPSGPCCESIFIPNAFSPNGDGRNDYFKLVGGAGVELLSTKVYTRWGEEIVATQNPFYSWDGKIKGSEAEIGTYFYFIEYKCKLVDESFELSGEFILIR